MQCFFKHELSNQSPRFQISSRRHLYLPYFLPFKILKHSWVVFGVILVFVAVIHPSERDISVYLVEAFSNRPWTAPLQAVASRWVRSEMNLPKTIHDVNRHIEMWASLRTFWFSAHFWASLLEVVLECFWTCIEGIVLEHRAQDGTING